MKNENGDTEISITENINEILEGFTLKARRKGLRRLKDITTFNVTRYLNCEGDLKYLNFSTTLKPLIKRVVITYSGDYIKDLNQNGEKIMTYNRGKGSPFILRRSKEDLNQRKNYLTGRNLETSFIHIFACSHTAYYSRDLSIS